MEITPSEIVADLDSVSLNNEVTKGLVPDQILGLKERVVEVNEELFSVGQSIRSIAANLAEIKSNIKGNWKAFINSGAINISPKSCQDLVSAHERWLANSTIEDHVLAPLSYRSLAVMGGTDKKPVTEKQRQKVYELVESGEKVTEATVRRFVQGATKAAKRKTEVKSESEKIQALKAKVDQYKKTIAILMDQNKKLKKQADDAQKALTDKVAAFV